MSQEKKMTERAIPVIAGPTASGKTALVLDVAEKRGDIEIISADSRQIYKGMDIGTAKSSPAEREAVPHHLIDILQPDQRYSAGQFVRDASDAIAGIQARGHLPVIVGGTGFYINALFQGLAAPASDETILAELEHRLDAEGYETLYQELLRIDPAAAALYPKENQVKTLRALTCWHQTGRMYSTYLEEGGMEGGEWEPHICLLMPERKELYERINQRTVVMVEEGLVEETRGLLDAGFRPDDPGLRTVGYREIIALLAGEMSEPQAIAAIQQSTRRYAKRQMTWFRNKLSTALHVDQIEEGKRWLEGM